MTNKRFTLCEINLNEYSMALNEIMDNGVPISQEKAIDLLNELNDECEFLEIDNESLKHGATKYAELYHKSLKENEQLKQEIETLQEQIAHFDIGDVE